MDTNQVTPTPTPIYGNPQPFNGSRVLDYLHDAMSCLREVYGEGIKIERCQLAESPPHFLYGADFVKVTHFQIDYALRYSWGEAIMGQIVILVKRDDDRWEGGALLCEGWREVGRVENLRGNGSASGLETIIGLCINLLGMTSRGERLGVKPQPLYSEAEMITLGQAVMRLIGVAARTHSVTADDRPWSLCVSADGARNDMVHIGLTDPASQSKWVATNWFGTGSEIAPLLLADCLRMLADSIGKGDGH